MMIYFLYLSFISILLIFFFNDTETTEIYTLSLHDALPISEVFRRMITEDPDLQALPLRRQRPSVSSPAQPASSIARSEEHTSELQSLAYLVCRLLLEKKKNLKCYHSIVLYIGCDATTSLQH